jgi:hypothetical protein
VKSDEVSTKMSKIIDVPGKIDFHVAVDDDLHNVVLMMVGTNNSKKIRMLRAFEDLANIDLIIERLQKAKTQVTTLRSNAKEAHEALRDARYIDTNVVDFIKWKKFAGIDVGPIAKTLDADKIYDAAQAAHDGRLLDSDVEGLGANKQNEHTPLGPQVA